jgi:hypothetical protein
MYQRGDRVLVEGFGEKRATLRVWEVRKRGLILCTEADYNEAVAGDGMLTALGFPIEDVVGMKEKTDP